MLENLHEFRLVGLVIGPRPRPNIVYILSQTTGERSGLAAGRVCTKKHILKNWFVYIILSKTT